MKERMNEVKNVEIIKENFKEKGVEMKGDMKIEEKEEMQRIVREIKRGKKIIKLEEQRNDLKFKDNKMNDNELRGKVRKGGRRVFWFKGGEQRKCGEFFKELEM